MLMLAGPNQLFNKELKMNMIADHANNTSSFNFDKTALVDSLSVSKHGELYRGGLDQLGTNSAGPGEQQMLLMQQY